MAKFKIANEGGGPQAPNPILADSNGFSLVESLMAMLILAIGLMFVGPMIYGSLQSTTLARSKDTAGLAAANQLETLSRLYRANAEDSNLTTGSHGPIQVEIVNPNDSTQMNRYNVGWTVANVPDARTGKILRAVQVTVRVTPTVSGSVGQNKVLDITTIFSFRG